MLVQKGMIERGGKVGCRAIIRTRDLLDPSHASMVGWRIGWCKVDRDDRRERCVGSGKGVKAQKKAKVVGSREV